MSKFTRFQSVLARRVRIFRDAENFTSIPMFDMARPSVDQGYGVPARIATVWRTLS